MADLSSISFHCAKSGSQVASYRGRQLSSFVNPEKEAQQWCAHYASLVQRKKTLVVLGLACGHHVELLMRQFSGCIFVVEHIEELRVHWRATRSKSSAIVLSPQDFEREMGSGKVTLPMGVLTFAPAIATDLDIYRRLFDRLCGRNEAALGHQFELRGQNHFFLPSDLKFDDPRASYRNLALSEGLDAKWKSLFHLLGEIVK